MSFGESIKTVFGKYATFSGRARRSEYWYFVLFNVIIGAALGALANSSTFFAVVDGIYALAVLLPGLAVGVRRLHDVGKSGWFILIGLIPLVGWIILIVKCCQDSDAGENAYGPSPKE